METPGTRSGRWLPVFPSSNWLALRFRVMFTGLPLLAVEIPGKLPSPEDSRRQVVLAQEPAPFAERQLVNWVRGHRVAHVDVRVAAIAGAAGLILERDALAGSVRRIGDPVGPHVLGLPQESAGEAPLERSLQRIKVVVAVVRLQTELGELRERALARSRIDAIDRVACEQMMTLAAHVPGLQG